MERTRTVTLLVADVVGSTELFSQLGEDAADVARRSLFATFDAAVAEGSGELIKTMGDGCLAAFGSAADAVTAAVALQHRAFALRHRAVPGLSLRVGLAVGDVTAEDGDVFGPAVVTASRLCDAAGEHQVLASETVRMLAGTRGGHRYESAGELILKGLADPVAACTVAVDAPSASRPLPAALARIPNEVVAGRERELDVLLDAAKGAAAGDRRVVLLAGEPGVGKTRLAAALARHAHEDGATVLFGRCEEDLAVPFQPFVDPLQALWAVLSPEERSDHVAVHGGELTRLVPALGGPEPIRADPELEQARLFDAVTDVLRRATQDAPLVLVLDDLHWAAAATVALVRHVLVDLPQARLLVVGTYRDTEVDRAHALGGLLSDVHRIPGVERLALRGLDLEGVEDLFVRASGDELDAGGRELAAAVAERTAGNPFFVNQVLRHLVERRLLVQQDGRWVVQGELDELDLPEGVLDVVGRRLSTLSPTANQALAVAALCGLSFNVRVLRAVPDAGDPDAVVDALDEAVRARLLVELGPGRLAFTHAIVREALRRELSTAKAARLHRALGQAILEVYGDGPDLPLAELARHFTEAALLGDTAAAARWATAAAAAAVATTDHRGAITLLHRALTVIEAAEPVDQEARFDVAIAIAEASYQLAEVDEEAAAAAVDAARRLRSAIRLLRIASAHYPGGTGIVDPQREWLYDEVLELLDEDQWPLRLAALANLAGHWAIQADNRFIPVAEEVLAEVPRLTEAAPQVSRFVRSWLGFAMLGLPGAARRLALAEEGDAIPADAADPWWTSLRTDLDWGGYQTGYHAHALLCLGRRAEFEERVEQMRARGERTGELAVLGMTEAQLGCVALLDGRFDDGLAQAQRMVDRAPGEANFLLSYFATHTQVLMERGEVELALGLVDAALAVSPDLAASKAGVAVAHLLSGRADEARPFLDELLGRWSDWGRDWSWPVALAWGTEAVALSGDPDAARMVLAELDAYSGELAIAGAAIYATGAYDRYRGMLLSVLGRDEEAVVALEAGLALEEALEAPALISRSRLWLARALRQRGGPGDLDRARSELAAAIATAERIGQASVLDPARALLTELGAESPEAGGAE